MNGIHDMGGMHGFGPMVIDPDEDPRKFAEWEDRVNVLLTVAAGLGSLNIDAFRYGIEVMEPVRYLQTPYFGRFAESLVWNLIRAGVITREELDTWEETLRVNPDAKPVPGSKPVTLPPPEEWPGKPLPATAPRFEVGDAVVTRNINHPGHTRLPRYARGKRGVIERVHEPEPFADDSANDVSAPMQATYRVRFDGRELWGDDAEPNTAVTLDLFDSYLLAADA